MSEWYIVYNGQQIGPMTKEQLLSYGLTADSKVWKEGQTEWVSVYMIPELMELVSAGAPAVPVYVQPPVYSVPNVSEEWVPSGKSKVAAGILAILLGGLGIQYFYLGKATAGVLTLMLNVVLPTLLTIFTCGGGLILLPLQIIFVLLYVAQGIEMLCMSDEKFDRTFVYTTSSWPFF